MWSVVGWLGGWLACLVVVVVVVGLWVSVVGSWVGLRAWVVGGLGGFWLGGFWWLRVASRGLWVVLGCVCAKSHLHSAPQKPRPFSRFAREREARARSALSSGGTCHENSSLQRFLRRITRESHRFPLNPTGFGWQLCLRITFYRFLIHQMQPIPISNRAGTQIVAQGLDK